ncbi:MAG: hypothetical protein KH436_08755 [Firmicutes bacterium]|jgi:hypothetical protein|nr:hypothetical protein [Clostridia bacterium]MBS6465001.1 hypothetical protein [Bacillota bacterium]
MITTRRSQSEITNERTNVATLEREVPTSFNEYLVKDAVNEADDLKVSERARISQNLDLLMNYEKYLDQKEEPVKAEAPVKAKAEAPAAPYFAPERAQTVEIPEKTAAAEDLKPSSTTMQFTETDMDTLYQDLQQEEESKGYYLNAKGKLMIALYALVVVAIMALIIINTSVLSALNLSFREKSENLAALQSRYEEMNRELDEISSDEHVIEIAEDEYNMIKG